MVSHILHESEAHLMPPFLYAAPHLYFLQCTVYKHLAKMFPVLMLVSMSAPLLQGFFIPICLADIWGCHVYCVFHVQCPLELYTKAALFPDHTIKLGCQLLTPRAHFLPPYHMS